MKLRDWKEVGVWACAAAVVAVGVLGARTAVSTDPPAQPKQPTAAVSGCRVTAEVRAAQELYKVDVTVSVANPAEATKRFDLPVTLVRTDFTGSPMSRVMRPDDYKTSDESTQTLHFAAAGMKTSARTLTVPIAARPPEKGTFNRPTYSVRVGDEKTGTVLVSFPAELAWPKK